ncbi:EamA family transporter [Actinobacteria bacterium YIM 96077]|uniref:EamA family transporter n=1 Tax=Phytoactinopolyspora halophila TaxID=1981511 RepID=A0A329QZS6_9ACTN|nr:EamA family transporter [Phytoactinopolyspora halophila]AYY11745.1 EamA family transporter [Actinobacteria bacterium YIM 96077]RAW17821.1 EamA family transporter [Phytoactinopolyspora halophila]
MNAHLRDRAAMSAALHPVPAPGLVVAGIVSVQMGAGIAKGLFESLPPSTVVFMRLLTSAVVLLLITRRLIWARRRDLARADVLVLIGFGLALATMNFAIYQSFSRIPLGIAVTIEFLGPLGVSVVFSRRRLDLFWVALAALGVLLLTRGDASALDPVGVLYALVAAMGWAAYILLSAETGRRFQGTSGLALASMVGMVVVAPIGLGEGGTQLWEPHLLAIAVGVGLLSSVIPYSLELEALRRMPAKVFGILMSLEPVVAALVGLVLLGEILELREWAAIGCVVVACVGATRTGARARGAPEA